MSNAAGCWIDERLRDTENWTEENVGALTKLVSDQAQGLGAQLEKYTQNLSAWLNGNSGDLHECQDAHTKDYGNELGLEILAPDECSEYPITLTDMWLDQHAHIAQGEELGEDLLNFFQVPELCASNVSGSLEDYAHVHIQFLKRYVGMLEQLWGATMHMLLEGHNTPEEAPSRKYIWDFFNMGPPADERGSAEEVTAQQAKCFSFRTWLGKHVSALEQWLQSITEE